MICKICGCEMNNNGDWFACPTCGSVHFGSDPDEDKNAAEPEIKEEPVSESEDEPPKKEEPLLDFDKLFLKIEEPFAEPEEKPVTKEEPPVEIAEPPVEITEPPVEIAKPFVDITEPFVETYEPSTEAADPADDAAPEPKERPRRKKSKKSEEENGEKKGLTLKDIVDFMLPIVAAIVIAFVLKTFIIANAKVPTGSMIDTINIEDRIIASRLAYKAEAPQRYDVVLFYFPDDENDIFVKRVLGLPGETLEVIDGEVYVTTSSGRTIRTEQGFVNPAEIPGGNYGPYYIPEKGEIITVDGIYCYAEDGTVLGHSNFIDKYCVKDDRGNYVIAENLYFMMGDNRNYSRDSRDWDFPYVAENKIIGKVLFKYYPSFEKIE